MYNRALETNAELRAMRNAGLMKQAAMRLDRNTVCRPGAKGPRVTFPNNRQQGQQGD